MKFGREEACSCVEHLQRHCSSVLHAAHAGTTSAKSSNLMSDNEFGKIAYTISILIMFSFVIILLMIRSIRRTNATIEVEALLDAMRFREELDIQERQKRRLLRAKHKVSAWLTKTHTEGTAKQWRSSPQLIQPRKTTSSTVSEIPEIVVTDDGPSWIPRRPNTPCLSLIYDFSNEHRNSMSTDGGSQHKSSICSQTSIATSRQSMSLDRECAPRLSIHSHSLSLG